MSVGQMFCHVIRSITVQKNRSYFVRGDFLLLRKLQVLYVVDLKILNKANFEIIVKINNKALNSQKRKRETYQIMVKTLKLLKEITSKKNETNLFLKELYNHKPNLPALKDEMRKARLIAV